MKEFQNLDGTYNGIKLMTKLTGLPEGEVTWTWARLRQLMNAEGKSRTEAMRILREEAKGKPWLKS